MTSHKQRPTSRMTDSGLGKIWTTSVRRLSSRLSRSIGLLDQILDQCAGGNFAYASRSSSMASSLSATLASGG